MLNGSLILGVQLVLVDEYGYRDFLEKDWWTKCKYEKNPIQIKGGIPSIVLCNPGSGSSYRDFLEKDKNSSLKRWTQDHCEFVFLSAPLF